MDVPGLTRLLIRYVIQVIPYEKERSHFKFIGATVNLDFACRTHRDSGTAGPSAIMSCGNYTGGDIRYWADDNGVGALNDIVFEQAATLKCRINIVMYGGRCAHAVYDFNGKRISLLW